MTQDIPAQDLRASCRAARADIGTEDRVQAARSIARRVTELVATRRPGRVGTYLPTDDELDPTLAIDALRALGWQAHLPVIGDERSLQFAEWVDGARLVPNRFGIDEPADPPTLITARALDLVLVPCVAVDPGGNRLGFGAGYYDRALSDAEDPRMTSSRPRPLLVGVAFERQVVVAVQHEPWDVVLDVVVCESATLMTGARGWPTQH